LNLPCRKRPEPKGAYSPARTGQSCPGSRESSSGGWGHTSHDASGTSGQFGVSPEPAGSAWATVQPPVKGSGGAVICRSRWGCGWSWQGTSAGSGRPTAIAPGRCSQWQPCKENETGGSLQSGPSSKLKQADFRSWKPGLADQFFPARCQRDCASCIAVIALFGMPEAVALKSSEPLPVAIPAVWPTWLPRRRYWPALRMPETPLPLPIQLLDTGVCPWPGGLRQLQPMPCAPLLSGQAIFGIRPSVGKVYSKVGLNDIGGIGGICS